jgi:hypothetical protein
MINYRKTVSQCQAVRYLGWTLLAFYGAGLVCGWLAPGTWVEAHGGLLLRPELRQPGAGLGERALGLATALPALVMLAWAMRALDRLMRAFEREEFFTEQALHSMASCATGLMAGMLLNIAQSFLFPLAAGLLGLHGKVELVLALAVQGNEFWALLACGLLRLMPFLMRSGLRLAQENSEFV